MKKEVLFIIEMNLFLILLWVATGNFLILYSTLLMISFVNLFLLEVGKEKLSPSCIKNWTLLNIGFDRFVNHLSLMEEIEGDSWEFIKDEGCNLTLPSEKFLWKSERVIFGRGSGITLYF